MGAKKLSLAAGLLTLAGVLFLTHESTYAQKGKGKTRPAETKYLMRGVVQSHCAALAKLLKDGPADDKAWDTATCHGAILSEMSYVLMDDGRCPDAAWAGAAKTLRECSAKVVDATKAKNIDEARNAFKVLTTACATCHKAHKS